MIPERIKVKGFIMNLGGEDYVLAPLALGPFQQLEERIMAFGRQELDEKTSTDTLLQMAYHSLRRNYEDITMERVGEIVGLEHSTDLFLAVMDVSGLRRKEAEAQSGEARLG